MASAAPAAPPTPAKPQPGPTPAAGHKAVNLPTIEDGFGPTAGENAAMAAASAKARVSGKPVAVPALTTEVQQVVAEPAGGFDLSANPNPVRTKQNGTWQPVNTALHTNANGTVSPAATAYGTVTFSGGGMGPLATTTSGSVTYTVSWPGRLPAPHVSGATATYANVLPGVDLEVSATTTGGFSDVLVVRTAAAAKNPKLASLALRTTSHGQVTSGAGGLTVSAPHAANTLVAATPFMWDSTTSTRPTAAPGRSVLSNGVAVPHITADPSDTSHPGLAARLAQVGLHAGKSSLTLTPDRGLLTDPSAKLPIYIDPTFNWHPTTGGTPAFDEVKHGEPCTNTSFFGNTGSAGDFGALGAGYNQFTSCFGPQRAYYQWKLPTVIWGAHIGNVTGQPGATVNVTKVFSQFCGVSSTDTMRQTGGIGAGTTWNSQPGAISTVGAKTLGPSNNDVCTGNPQPSAGYDVTSQIAAAAREHSPQFTVALIGNESAASHEFSRFSDNPTLQIFYNRVPNTPGANSLLAVTGNDKAACTTTTPYPFIGKTIATNTPVLTARITDPDGDLIKANYRYWVDGTTTMTTGSSADNLASGTQAKLNMSPTFVSALTNGKIVDWQVSVTDGEDTSAWSVVCHFIAEPTAPSAPSITSQDGLYPDNDTAVSTAGTPGRFTLQSTGGAVTGIVDGLDQAPPTTGVPAADNAPFGAGGVLSVAGRWKMSDGSGTTDVDSSGHSNAITLSGGASWATDMAHGQVLSLDGTSGFAATNRPVINTAGSFTVSAWVRPTALTTQTFFAQEGDTSGAFSLGYNATTASWFWARPNTATSSTSVTVASPATSAQVLNVWTHLSGSYDASTGQMALFVNDLAVATGSDSTPWDSSGVFVIGHGYTSSTNTNFVHGLISDVQVYQAPVSPSDLSQVNTGGTVSPAGRWQFTDSPGSTTAADSSGNGHTVTLSSGATLSAATPTSPPSLNLNGTTGAATAAGPILNTMHSFTISAWVKITDATDFSVIATQQSTNQAGFLLDYDPEVGKWAFARLSADTLTGATTHIVESTGAAAMNTWTHLAASFSTTTNGMTLYVNGAPSGTSTTDPTPFNASGPFVIGHGFINGAANDFTHGSIADVQVYSTSLDASEAAMLYQSSTATITPLSPGPHTLFGYTKDAAGDVSGYQSYQFQANKDPGKNCASLAVCYDNKGISTDGTTGTPVADFDGAGRSFSAQDLAAAGWQSGGHVEVDGANFQLPTFGGNTVADNVLAANQTITFNQPISTAGATALEFLVSSTNSAVDGGMSTGTVNGDNTVPAVPAGVPVADTFCFTGPDPDGMCAPRGTISFNNGTSTQPYFLTVPDWSGSPQSIGAAWFPHENLPGGTQNANKPEIYAFAVPIDAAHAGSTITSVTLPDVSTHVGPGQEALHVFSMAVRNTTTDNAPTGQTWTGSWASPTEGVFNFGSTFTNQTIRETVVPTVSGNTWRLRLDDALGVNPLDISDATVAVQQVNNSPAPTAAPVPLVFSDTGTSATNIPEGGMVYATKAAATTFPVRAGQKLLVSFTLTNSIPFLVMHTDASNGDQMWITAAGSGDHTGDTTTTAFSGTGTVFTAATSVVTGMDVATNGTPTTVVLGDGIIDHADALGTANADTNLIGNLMSDTPTTPAPAGVLNEGMESNQMITDYPESDGSGPALLSRLDRDLLDQPNLQNVIVDEGLEDVLAGTSAQDLTTKAFSLLTTDLTDANINIIYVGLTPCAGYAGDGATPNDACTTAVDHERLAVNGFFQTNSGGNESYVDSDSAVGTVGADDITVSLTTTADAGDHVNLADDGYAELATGYLGPQNVWSLNDGADDGTVNVLADNANGNIPYLANDQSVAAAGVATLNGTPTWTEDPPGHTVLTLDGATNYGQTSAPMLNTTASFTVSAWVKLSTGTKTGVIASQVGTDGSAFTLRYDTDGSDSWSLTQSMADGDTDYGPGTVWADDSDAADMTPGHWAFVVGSYDAATHALSISVNGNRDDSISGNWPTWNAGGPLLIGAGQSVADGSTTLTTGITNFFPGEISDVRAWNYSLDDQQIKALFDQGKPVFGLTS